jgi:hypothetical protein
MAQLRIMPQWLIATLVGIGFPAALVGIAVQVPWPWPGVSVENDAVAVEKDTAPMLSGFPQTMPSDSFSSGRSFLEPGEQFLMPPPSSIAASQESTNGIPVTDVRVTVVDIWAEW